MKKVVFSKEKFYDFVRNNKGFNEEEKDIKFWTWAEICDGLTYDEAKKLGYLLSSSWMIEVEEKQDYFDFI